MTRFVDIPAVSQLIEEIGVVTFIGELTNHIEEDFKQWENYDKSARVANHSEIGVIELMPVSDKRCYAFKYVNRHPGNTELELHTVMVFGVLADVKTGYPLLSELTVATALRTCATIADGCQSIGTAR